MEWRSGERRRALRSSVTHGLKAGRLLGQKLQEGGGRDTQGTRGHPPSGLGYTVRYIADTLQGPQNILPQPQIHILYILGIPRELKGHPLSGLGYTVYNGYPAGTTEHPSPTSDTQDTRDTQGTRGNPPSGLGYTVYSRYPVCADSRLGMISPSIRYLSLPVHNQTVRP